HAVVAPVPLPTPAPPLEYEPESEPGVERADREPSVPPTFPPQVPGADQRPTEAHAVVASQDALPPPAAPADTPTVRRPVPLLHDGGHDVTRGAAAHLAETQVAPTPMGPGSTAPYDAVAPAEPPSASPQRRLWLKALVAFVLLVVLAALGLVGYLLLRTERHEVPQLAGVTEAEAVSAVENFDWDVQTRFERSDEEPDAGDVIRTSPAPGDQLAEGEPFFLVLSEGPEFRTLPQLRGAGTGAAREQLEVLRLEASTADRVYDEEIPPGAVVSWVVVGDEAKRAGDGVLPGTEIELTLSRGPEPRSVPDLRTLSLAQATGQLDELGLRLDQAESQFSNIIEKDLILRQRPRAGAEVERGAVVTVRVSKGPDFVVFPELDGLNFRQAVRALERAGYVRGDVLGSTQGLFEGARINGVSVDTGEQFVRGTRVDLVFL
ncbi:MAG: PASTA domain-containing protein, partial [Ilumatobacteraceae bacterium]